MRKVVLLVVILAFFSCKEQKVKIVNESYEKEGTGKEVVSNLDNYLIAKLDTIRNDDQEPRKRLRKIQEKYGNDSFEIKKMHKEIRTKDSLNLIKVRGIIDKRGWLSKDVIGKRGNTTLFMVIQHADLAVQEKYLPLMQKAVQQGDLKSSHLALLEDRIAMRKGKRQIYGSQVLRDKDKGTRYFYPIIDPDNVDKRRMEVGLDSIQDYAKLFNISWDLDLYKKQLPEVERKLKITE